MDTKLARLIVTYHTEYIKPGWHPRLIVELRRTPIITGLVSQEANGLATTSD